MPGNRDGAGRDWRFGFRELILRRIRSFADVHVEPWKTRIFILLFYSGVAHVLCGPRILRFPPK